MGTFSVTDQKNGMNSANGPDKEQIGMLSSIQCKPVISIAISIGKSLAKRCGSV